MARAVSRVLVALRDSHLADPARSICGASAARALWWNVLRCSVRWMACRCHRCRALRICTDYQVADWTNSG